MGNSLATKHEEIDNDKTQLLQSIAQNDLFTFSILFPKFSASLDVDEISLLLCKAYREKSYEIIDYINSETNVMTYDVKKDLIDEMCDKPWNTEDIKLNKLIIALAGAKFSDIVNQWKGQVSYTDKEADNIGEDIKGDVRGDILARGKEDIKGDVGGDVGEMLGKCNK